MGAKTSTQLKNEAVREREKIEIEDIYCMFDETIEAVRTSKLLLSQVGQDEHPPSSSAVRINNLEQVLDQLLEGFKAKESHSWGKDIFKMFKKHFRGRFQEMWPINKEEFYKLVLSNCHFETMDLQNELREIAQSLQIHGLDGPKARMSYERYFYDVGAAKIQEKLPSSFVDVLPWEESFKQPDEKETQFNMAAINETIIKQEHEETPRPPEQQEEGEKTEKVQQAQVRMEKQDSKEVDFLPLFINSNSDKKQRISQLPSLSQSRKNDIYDIYKNARVQNVSVISPQTVFFQRLSKQNKAEISDLVKFYRQFANALEQMFFSSTSMVSAPYKHFLYCIDEKMKRKNIRQKDPAPLSGPSKAKLNTLLFSERPEGRKYRQRREFNNKLLLIQIKEFAQAYTDFVWMFLELNQIGQSKLGKLLNIYTLYGIVVKSIWKFVSWISDRGCEYEQHKIEDYYHHQPMPNNPRIPVQRKKVLLALLRRLSGEKNPQKYLKKIVIFYRQANKACGCADDLINLYEELLVWVIKEGRARDMAIFRMPPIIETLLKLDETLSSAGEISYSWTTWTIVIEILKERIDCGRMQPPTLSRVQTEPDYEEVMLDE